MAASPDLENEEVQSEPTEAPVELVPEPAPLPAVEEAARVDPEPELEPVAAASEPTDEQAEVEPEDSEQTRPRRMGWWQRRQQK